MMHSSGENRSGMIGPVKDMAGGPRGIGDGKYAAAAGNRRALSEIDRNVLGAPPPHPCAGSKRVLSERQRTTREIPSIPVHRPVTRKFAAQLANNSRHKVQPEETKKSVHRGSSSRDCNDDCTILDAEDDCDVTASDFSAPMSMMDEIDRMEVEMEDIAEEAIVDIDSGDKKDPLAVVEYIDELYSFYKKAESSTCVPPNYMENQSDINDRMRGILIDWLIEVHYKFELMDETLYLTVNLIDRFLAVHQVVRKKLQLVGVTAMLLACKYEEVSVPVVEDLILISDSAYSRQEILYMEKLMVNTLQFNLSVPTPYVFMRRFLKAAQSDKKLKLLSFFMIELCLVEYEMLRFPPSLLAAAAVYTSQCALTGYKQWSRTSEWHTAYSEEQLQECSRLMVKYHRNAATGKLTGVHRKYSTSKFGYAARVDPPHFILERGQQVFELNESDMIHQIFPPPPS